MKRRKFTAATAVLLVSSLGSRAQGKPRRLGFLTIGERPPTMGPNYTAFLNGLRNHGWIDGQNLIIEWRYAQSQDHLPALAAELVALSPDLLIADGPQPAATLKSATTTHSDSIRCRGRSRRARSRPKPGASRRQHNGSYDFHTGGVHSQNGRTTMGNCSYRVENCDALVGAANQSESDDKGGHCCGRGSRLDARLW